MHDNITPKLEVLEAIQNEAGRKDRYTYAKVSVNGQVRFSKTATPGEEENLTRELVWVDFMEYVQNKYPDAHLRAPRQVKRIDQNTILTEWIDAPFVAKPRDGAAWKGYIERYTDMLVLLDQAALNYTVPESLRTYTPRNIQERLDQWLHGIERTQLISDAYEHVAAHVDTAEFVMQHGDLTPWQIFDCGEEWVIFDGERAGDDLPRFNDVAYSYGRLALRSNEPRAAQQMLQNFVAQRRLSAEEQSGVKLAVLARLLGMAGDAYKEENQQEIRGAEVALRACLNDELFFTQSNN